VVLISQRLERGPVDSRVGVFPEVFGMAGSRSESTEGRSKPGVGWRLRLVSLVMMIGACLSSKERKLCKMFVILTSLS